MKQEILSQKQIPSEGYEVIARMVKYVRKELPHHRQEKITNAIQNCKECREIYNEVIDFLNESPDPEFSNKHRALMQSNKRHLNKLVASSLKASNSSNFSLTNNNDENELAGFYDTDECHSCGA